EVALALPALGLLAERLDPELAGADRRDQVLLALPAGAERARALVQVGELGSDRLDALLRVGAPGFLERRALDLELADLPLERVELGRQRIDRGAELRRGLVDAVDRLVRHEPVGDVTAREPRGGDEGLVEDPD